jgi:diaminopimelate decarboxylase
MIQVVGNELQIGDIPISSLVEKYGEPIYIYDAEVIERQFQRIRASLPEQVEVLYSMKANPNISILYFLKELAQGVEVSSLRELYVARQAGFSADRILFVGPSKSENEIREAIADGIFCLAVESEREMLLADEIAAGMGRKIDLAIRINPSIDVAGPKLKMGGGSRQFGIDEEGIEGLFAKAVSLKHARFMGIHVYLGTRILDYRVALKNTIYSLELGKRLSESIGVEMKMIDFGGGLGVPYFIGEDELDLDGFGRGLREVLSEYRKSMPHTRLVMELGRYLIAESGVYVTRVRFVKKSRGQTFVLVGGGMNHHQATTSIGALVKNHFPIEILNKMDLPKDQTVNVCGPLCTPGDVLGKSVKMVEVAPGDLLGVMRSGAYGLTASPVGFLSHGSPAEVMVYRGNDSLVRKQSAVEDILNDQRLAYMKPVEEQTVAQA